VIFNPVKVSATFREATEQALDAHGPYEITWLETEADDKGRSRVQQAVRDRVDLVLVAGGDGTVRVVADGLAKSGIPLGIVPAGTANLLALNLGIPNNEAQALEVAVAGRERTIDLVKLTIDGHRVEHFAVMAGAGFDAMIMDETDPELKAKIGSAAYFLSIGKAMGRLPIKVRIELGDSHHTRRRNAILILFGNVGRVQGITLFPDALPDDGKFDLMIASPRRWRDWLKVLGRLITRRPQKDDPVEIHSDTRARVRLKERDQFQLDGDVEGDFLTMDAEVVPGALTVRVPEGG
jgi:YegS/Rv2252/BmrU family lipid kinase